MPVVPSRDLDGDFDFSQTQRQLNFRRRKEEIKKKLNRLQKLQRLREDAESSGDGEEVLVQVRLVDDEPRH